LFRATREFLSVEEGPRRDRNVRPVETERQRRRKPSGHCPLRNTAADDICHAGLGIGTERTLATVRQFPWRFGRSLDFVGRSQVSFGIDGSLHCALSDSCHTFRRRKPVQNTPVAIANSDGNVEWVRNFDRERRRASTSNTKSANRTIRFIRPFDGRSCRWHRSFRHSFLEHAYAAAPSVRCDGT
jgi:hypothetical protein